MDQRQAANLGSQPSRIDTICRISYELGLILAALTLAMIAVHGLFTHHFNIDQTLDETHASSTVAKPGLFHIGEAYPLYRFNEGWEAPIGRIVAERTETNRVIFNYDPKKLLWPMGRHGRVIGATPDRIRLNIGQNMGFAIGTKLNIFDGRSTVGQAILESIGAEESVAIPLSPDGKLAPQSLLGDTVTEFVVATQVVAFNAPLLVPIECIVVVAVLAGYVLFWKRKKSSPMTDLLPVLASRVRIRPGLKLYFHAVIGIPIVWFLTVFGMQSFCYGILLIYRNLIHDGVPTSLTYDALQSLVGPLFAVLIVLYEITVWRRRVSPFLIVAKRLAFRGGLYGHAANDAPEHLTMWILQAIIVFTFARMLSGFVQGNLSLGISASWPDAPPVLAPDVDPISLKGIERSIASLAFAFTHVPKPANQDMMYMTIRYAINNLGIVGGLFGYGYSVLGYLWGKRVRNVDFTVGGWLVNAVCYGPLFGNVLWHMLPPPIGFDPNITNGPLHSFSLFMEAFTNLVYILTIWNLGTMFGLMTDKGLRTSKFYSVVRHPSYTIEAFMLVLMYSRGLSSAAQWYAVSFYFITLWIRSEREDQFMTVSNPDFEAYKQRVPYKFIPGIY